LLGKSFATEFRSRELLTTTVVFILTIVVLFSFTFDPLSATRAALARTAVAGFLFAASLMLQPCFLREQNNDTLSALRLSVNDRLPFFSPSWRRTLFPAIHAGFASACVLGSVTTVRYWRISTACAGDVYGNLGLP